MFLFSVGCLMLHMSQARLTEWTVMRCKSLEDETLCAIACTTVGVTVTLQCCADVLRYVLCHWRGFL